MIAAQYRAHRPAMNVAYLDRLERQRLARWARDAARRSAPPAAEPEPVPLPSRPQPQPRVAAPERRLCSPDAARAAESYEELRRALSAQGLDPDLIGEHEVDPVHCQGCGKPIPWAVLKGFRS